MRFFPEPNAQNTLQSKMSQKRVRMAMKNLKAMEMVISDVDFPVFDEPAAYADYAQTRRNTHHQETSIVLQNDTWVQQALGAPTLDTFRAIIRAEFALAAAIGQAEGQFAGDGVLLTVDPSSQSLKAASIRNPTIVLNGLKTGIPQKELKALVPKYPADHSPQTVIIQSQASGYTISLVVKKAVLEEIRIERHKPDENSFSESSDGPKDEPTKPTLTPRP